MLTLRNLMGGSKLTIEKRVGWVLVLGTRLGVDHSEVVDPSPALVRGVIVSMDPSI